MEDRCGLLTHMLVRYRLYLRAIGRALEGVITITTGGIADYSSKGLCSPLHLLELTFL